MKPKKPMKVKRLADCPALLPRAAAWFSEKWGIPQEAYAASMRESLNGTGAVPRWYLVQEENGAIIAGAGIIENDFHNRKDLAPNLCALFVEEAHRRQGLARAMLDAARQDMAALGIPRLYLVTEHTRFYEKCGWEFLTAVTGEDGQPMRLYTVPTLPG